MGLVLFTPATAMEVMTGFPLWGSVVITGTVATVYTTLVSMQHDSISCEYREMETDDISV